MTPPRTCAIKFCDIKMPIHGSRDVQHDDESHHDAPFINQAPHDVSCDIFCHSSHEGREACADDQSLRISGDEQAKIDGRTLGGRSHWEHTERLSLWSPVPPFPSLAAVCVSARGPSFPSNPTTHLSVVMPWRTGRSHALLDLSQRIGRRIEQPPPRGSTRL
jgi:hypothetical protein